MNQQPWYQRFPKDEFGGEQSLLTCEEYGFFTRLRDFCWENDGLLFDEKILQRFAKAQKLSPYKFKKVWQVVENFFQIIDGKLRYVDDERRRLSLVERQTKCKISGLKGAESRWKKQLPLEMPREDFTDGDRHSEKVAVAIENYGNPDPYPDPYTHNEAPPPASSTEGLPRLVPEAGGGGPPYDEGPETDQALPDVSTHFFQRMVVYCASNNIPTPDRRFCAELVARFPNRQDPQLYPVFYGQKSPGLWLKKTNSELDNELISQANQPERKPPMSRREAEDLRLAGMVDQLKKRKAGV